MNNFEYLKTKTRDEFLKNEKYLNEYFLTSLGDASYKELSLFSIRFINQIYDQNLTIEKFNKALESVQREKDINEIFILKEIKDLMNKAKLFNDNSKKLCAEKNKQYIKLKSTNQITLNEFKNVKSLINIDLEFLKHKFFNLDKNLKTTEKQLIKRDNYYKSVYGTLLSKCISNDYFVSNTKVDENKTNTPKIMSFDNIDFFHICDNNIVFFDGYKYLKLDELLDILCKKDLFLNDSFMNNNYISFYLVYFYNILNNNKDFELNYKTMTSKFKKVFSNYYNPELLVKLESRFQFWNEALNYYNNTVEEKQSIKSWGLLYFLTKEFVFELNRLLILIVKMTLNEKIL